MRKKKEKREWHRYSLLSYIRCNEHNSTFCFLLCTQQIIRGKIKIYVLEKMHLKCALDSRRLVNGEIAAIVQLWEIEVSMHLTWHDKLLLNYFSFSWRYSCSWGGKFISPEFARKFDFDKWSLMGLFVKWGILKVFVLFFEQFWYWKFFNISFSFQILNFRVFLIILSHNAFMIIFIDQ
jgi:hypothetical protein